MLKNIFLLIVAMLFATQAVAGMQQHSYKPLTRTKIVIDGIAQNVVSSKKDEFNFIYQALRADDGLAPVNNYSLFRDAATDALDNLQENYYLQKLIISQKLQQGILEYSRQYGCKEWRFRHGAPKGKYCGISNTDDYGVEQVLFGDNNIVVNYPTPGVTGAGPVSYEIFSPKTTNRSSIWYGAHTIDGIIGFSDETLLTVYISFYHNVDDVRKGELFKTLTVFLVVPKPAKVYKQSSDINAGDYVRKNVKILRTRAGELKD